MDVRKSFTGGDPRALQGVDEAVQAALGDDGVLDDLFECLFADDAVVRMRAGDALEKVCREKPDRLEPYVDRLLGEVSQIDQASVRWHLAQMLGEVGLDGQRRASAVEILEENFDRADDWIVINCSLTSLATLAASDRSLLPYLTGQLDRFEKSASKAVSKRAATIRSENFPEDGP